jgi:ribonuclease T2
MDKTECVRETTGSFDATHLSLHGLWPQPRGISYCHVPSPEIVADKNHAWDRLPEPELTATTRQRLSAVMPGFQSGLERHEWIEHGTCSGVAANVYFNRAAELTEQINASTVRELFNQNIGQTLSAADIRAAFDRDFGADAGTRVMVQCQGQGPDRLITQIVVSLQGDVTGSAPIGALIGSADSGPQGCPSGIVAAPAR